VNNFPKSGIGGTTVTLQFIEQCQIVPIHIDADHDGS